MVHIVFQLKYENCLKTTFLTNLLIYLIFHLQQASVPTLLKTAKVIPIHKKESKLDFTNYHPISLLSNLDKILEKLMHNRLYKFLNDYNIIYLLQFGFKQKYSISFALIHLTEKIREALDQGKYSCGIFVDLKKTLILLIIRVLEL